MSLHSELVLTGFTVSHINLYVDVINFCFKRIFKYTSIKLDYQKKKLFHLNLLPILVTSKDATNKYLKGTKFFDRAF